jgi:hypothetical protein
LKEGEVKIYLCMSFLNLKTVEILSLAKYCLNGKIGFRYKFKFHICQTNNTKIEPP